MTGTGGEVSGQKRNRINNRKTKTRNLTGDKLNGRYDRHEKDFFIEPSWSVEALVRAEKEHGGFGSPCWDPACGSGTIPTVLRASGYRCCASDIAQRGFASSRIHDFVSTVRPPDEFDPIASIVCNPPYRIAAEFCERALSIATYKVAMLVQSKFPYSQRRHSLFTIHPPARLYFLSDRPSMPPGDQFLAGEITAHGGKMDFLWLVWATDHDGPTEAYWLRRPK